MTRFKNGRPLPDGALGSAEAAAIAKVTQRTIVAWIRKGWLPAKKFSGGRGPYLIMEGDLMDLIDRIYTPQPYDPDHAEHNGDQP